MALVVCVKARWLLLATTVVVGAGQVLCYSLCLHRAMRVARDAEGGEGAHQAAVHSHELRGVDGVEGVAEVDRLKPAPQVFTSSVRCHLAVVGVISDALAYPIRAQGAVSSSSDGADEAGPRGSQLLLVAGDVWVRVGMVVHLVTMCVCVCGWRVKGCWGVSVVLLSPYLFSCASCSRSVYGSVC